MHKYIRVVVVSLCYLQSKFTTTLLTNKTHSPQRCHTDGMGKNKHKHT